MTDFDTILGLDDDLDLTEEGFQPVTDTFTISDVDVAKNERGTMLSYTLSNPDVELFGKPCEQSFREWLSFPENEIVARIGRSNIKRLANAALGTAAFKPIDLDGAMVVATLSEDKRGFIQAKGFKTVK